MSLIVDQVDRNYAVFARELPNLLQTHPGKFAILHDEAVVGFLASAKDAVVEGMKRFGPGNYSVQEITGQPDDLGFYSYAGGALQP